MARGALASGELGRRRLPSRSMPGAACSISAFMTKRRGGSTGPLLIAPDDAADLLPRELRRRGRERRGAARRGRRAAGAHASRRRCPSFSRAPQRSPRSPLRAARPCRRSSRFICARPMPRPQAQAVVEALMPVEIACPSRRAVRCVASMAAIHASCFAQGLGRGGDGAIPRRPRHALPDRLGRRRLGRRRPRLADRPARPPTRPSSSRSASRPPAAARASAARCSCEAAMDASRSSGATQLFLEVEDGNEAALALYRSLGAVPVGQRPGYYRARRRRRDLQPCPFSRPRR